MDTVHHLALSLQDLNSGLVGPLIVCRKGTKENIVHRVLFFMTFDENESWYIEENINTYAQEPSQVDRNDITFKRSNGMHGNVHSLTHWLAPTGGSAQREQIKVCIRRSQHSLRNTIHSAGVQTRRPGASKLFPSGAG